MIRRIPKSGFVWRGLIQGSAALTPPWPRASNLPPEGGSTGEALDRGTNAARWRWRSWRREILRARHTKRPLSTPLKRLPGATPSWRGSAKPLRSDAPPDAELSGNRRHFTRMTKSIDELPRLTCDPAGNERRYNW